jgi:DNA-binding LacI/PurR family transcriptional regulator
LPPTDMPSSPLKRVHLIVQENYLRTEGLLSDGIIVGMHEELPAAQMQFNFTPAENDAAFMNELVAEAMRSRKTEGFVLIRSTLAIQRIAAASGLPVVVHGSVNWSVPMMPWIDRDHQVSGTLQAKYLIENGYENILVLMRDRMFRGDHTLFDAVRDAWSAAGHSTSSLTLRCLPHDSTAIMAAVSEMVEKLNGRRFGVICRSEPLAVGAEAAVKAHKLTVGRDVNIILADVYRKGSEAPPVWPHVRSVLTPEQIGQHIGRMLAQQALGKPVEPDHEVIPVYLQVPKGE